jgi:hypothetical protein
MNFKKYFNTLILISLLFACNQNPLNVNPRNKDLNITYKNLDSLFVNVPENKLINEIKKYHLNENEILSYQLNHCLGIGNISDSLTAKRIKLFVSDSYISRLETRIHEKFTKLNKIIAKINSGFLFLNHHFPTKKLPKNIIFMNSFFASNVFCTEHEIGIGLERYLGSKTDVIKELPSQEFFQWVKDKMDSKFLERDVLTAWIMTHYIEENKENIAAAIVNWGKIIYLTEASFPNLEKPIILRYSQKEFDWCEKNEFAFWKYLVQEKLLFSKNERDMANFINEAPFTIGLPEKGPDRFGQFLGWKMIHSFMKNNPSTTLEELVNIKYTKILQEYEP